MANLPNSKFADSGLRIVNLATDKAKLQHNRYVTVVHLFLAFIQLEWDLFSKTMKHFKIDPQKIMNSILSIINDLVTTDSNREPQQDQETNDVLKLALRHAARFGRPQIESRDIFYCLLNAYSDPIVSIIDRLGVESSRIQQYIVELETEIIQSTERLKNKFELPPFLKHFATNLNQLAHMKKIHPAFGRDAEIKQMCEILCHQERANSVILIGESGVGKTVIAEGLAWKIEFENDQIPPRLRHCQIINLQMNTIVAGTTLRGMFEDRIQNIINEIKGHPNLILFIDEAHTLVGAGSALGAPSDAANMFKSVLGRGEVRIIASTTLEEYKQYIMEDEALARRFRTVMVNEPSIEETCQILNQIKPRLESFYVARITDEAIETCLEMASRYMRHLRLPDKVIGWLDTASVRAEIAGKMDVTAEDILDVIATTARIPKDMVLRDTTQRFKDIETKLAKRVIGQRRAIEAVSRQLILNKGPLKENFDRPDGVLLFLGPTGVGKTELAKAVAEFLFGNEKRMIRIDMSEYQSDYGGGGGGIDKLIGYPKGIVDSQRGGILTNQLRDNPYSVVLLDEIEKAPSSLLNLFLQAFDEGWITDGRGKRVYLSDAIVIMTSNLGSQYFHRLTNPLGFNINKTSLKEIESDIIKETEKRFAPEFRNRIDEVVIFSPLAKDEVRTIAANYIQQTNNILARLSKVLIITEEAMDKIVKNGYSLAYGARFLKRFINDHIKAPISVLLDKSDVFTAVVRNGNIDIEVKKKPSPPPTNPSSKSEGIPSIVNHLKKLIHINNSSPAI